MAEGTENILQLFKTIPAGKKISFLIIFCIVIGGFTALLMYTNRPDYQVLFSNLDTSDAAKISEKLRENRTPFQLKDSGHAILVPSNMVYQLRLDMASEGIPRGSSVGFEIFDNMSFGTTEFVQKMRYQQALQGELARTIMEFDSIAQARVHIVPAGESLFAEPEKPASASVVIRQNPGKTLNQRHLQGIINLVTCAVEGLKPENVTVVDMVGGMLLKGTDEDSVGDLSRSQFEYRRNLEKNYEKQIETLLQPVVGLNSVVARVSAEVDLKRVNISEEKYDPDNVAIRSERRQKENSSEGDKIPQGSPDLKYQIYESQGEVFTASTSKYQKENSEINYEINRVARQVTDASGEIKRLTAAVIIDGPYVSNTDGEGNMTREFTPRTRKEMKTFEDIVKKAIGFNEGRGDQVTVTNVAFDIQKEVIPDSLPVTESEEGWLSYLKKASKPLINVIMVILFFFIAIKPFKRWLSQTSEYVSTRALPPGAAQLDEIEEDTRAELQHRQSNKLKLLEATRENPDMAADIIKTWLNEVS